MIVNFAKWQADIIREYCPNQFITHNYMGFNQKVNYYDLGTLLDFVSNDSYPAGYWQKTPHQPDSEIAASYDVVRGYKKKTVLDDGTAGGHCRMGIYGTSTQTRTDGSMGNAVCSAWSR